MKYQIASKNNEKVKHAYSLHYLKYRNEYKEFLVEGKKAIELGLNANLIKEVFTLNENNTIPDSIPQYIVNEDIIKKLGFTQNPEGIIAVAKYPNFVEKKYEKVVYLDSINDPGNFGTIIRTSLAFNYDAIVISKNTVSPYNEKVIAASKGAIFSIPVFYGELKRYFEDQKIIVSTLGNNSISLEKLEKPKRFILVLGNEAHGVSEETLAKSDINVKIDISNIDSLNVSIAAGILLYHLK